MLISIFWQEKINLRGIYSDFMIILSTKNSSTWGQTPLTSPLTKKAVFYQQES
jgi:hypothetical protein